MIWTVWRQHRAELLIVSITLAALATVLIVTGIQATSAYQSLGVGPCLSATNHNLHCSDIVEQFRSQFGWLASDLGWLNLAPILVAMLIGAPLVAREVERHTHVLAWTQSVTRRRWLTVKLTLVIGGAVVVSAALTALITWWRIPFDALNGRMSPGGFDFEGLTPIAYMLFAMSLAIAFGALIRHSIPAMVATLAVFLGVRLPIELWVRPYLYQTPITLNTEPLSPTAVTRADWTLDFNFVDQSGHTMNNFTVFSTCASGTGPAAKLNVFQCVQAHGWLISTVYQPASRFWQFQFTEAAIYFTLSVALIAFTFWFTHRRIA